MNHLQSAATIICAAAIGAYFGGTMTAMAQIRPGIARIETALPSIGIPVRCYTQVSEVAAPGAMLCYSADGQSWQQVPAGKYLHITDLHFHPVGLGVTTPINVSLSVGGTPTPPIFLLNSEKDTLFNFRTPLMVAAPGQYVVPHQLSRNVPATSYKTAVTVLGVLTSSPNISF